MEPNIPNQPVPSEVPATEAVEIPKFSKPKFILIILALIVLIVVGTSGYYIGSRRINKQKTAAKPTVVSTATSAPVSTCGPCAQFSPPAPDFCKNGTIISQSADKCGCPMPPICKLITSTQSITIVPTTNPTANWKTYTNATYKLSFKYPSEWTVTEKDESSYGDARKYSIGLNYENGINTFNSYTVEILNAGNMSGNQFINSYYNQLEAGPSRIKADTLNNKSIYRFFMQKASSSLAGSAFILFQNSQTVITVANIKQEASSIDEIMNDKMLSDIASTIQFNQ